MNEIKVPFTRSLTVILTKDVPVAQQQADDHLKAVQDGFQVIFHPSNEAYFHRLRKRVSEKPELAEKIAVFYQDVDGTLKEVGLRYEDELRWPVGFGNELWEEEMEIIKIRGCSPLRSDEELRAAGCTCIDACNECPFHKPKKKVGT